MHRTVAGLLGGLTVLAAPAAAQTPRSPASVVVDTLHGRAVADPYRWLEDLTNPATERWARAQDDRYRAAVAGLPEVAAIRDQITAFATQPWQDLPYRRGTRLIWHVQPAGGGQPVLFASDRGGPARKVFDPAIHLPEGTNFIGTMDPGPSGRTVAMLVARGQSNWQRLRFLDVQTGNLLPDDLGGVRTAGGWADADAYFYVRYDEPAPGAEQTTNLVNPRVMLHRLGRPQGSDQEFYRRPDKPAWRLGVQVTDDRRFLLVTARDQERGGQFLFVRDLANAADSVRPLIAHDRARYQLVGNRGTELLFLTDDMAPRGRVVAVDAVTGAVRTVIAEQENPILQAIVAGSGFLLKQTVDARRELHVFDAAGRHRYQVALPGITDLGSWFDRYDGEEEAFYMTHGLTGPPRIFRLDLRSGVSTRFGGGVDLGFDPDDFLIEQVFYRSRDGTRVPMFVARKNGTVADGRRPVWLYAYGTGGWSAFPWFSGQMLTWMERGGVYAFANVRGGGEYGEEWHLAGVRDRRQNAIDDYIAAAEWLERIGWTRRGGVLANGGSASGNLAAAATIQRPELFGAAVINLPTLDMLRFHRFAAARGRIPEWGSPEDPAMFAALRAYSPYHNLEPGRCYPATLVQVGEKDELAPPLHGYKYTARLQETQGCADRPALLRVAWGVGHGSGRTAPERWQAEAEEITFGWDALHKAMGRDGAAPGADAAGLAGGWEGTLRAEGVQPISLRLCVRNGDASIDLPAFGWYERPGVLRRAGDRTALTFSVYSDSASIEVVPAGPDSAAGRWRAAGASGDVSLRRSAGCGPRYRAERFDFEGEGGRLAGTLLLPPGASAGVPVPAVVWTHGSGDVGRDDPIYRGLAAALAERGVASLIYDKRGVGASEGDWKRTNMSGLARDAVAAVRALRRHPAIDSSLVGVGGMSQGGWIAPDAAAHSDAPAFVLVLSAPGITPAEQNLFNQYNKVLAAGFTKAHADRADALLREIYRYYLSGEGREHLEAKLGAASREPWFEAAYELAIWHRRGILQGPVSDEYRGALYYDPELVWPRVSVPTVAVWGAEDLLVPALRSRRAVAAGLDRAGTSRRMLERVPGADHDLRLPRQAPWPWGRFHPGYAAVADFIRGLRRQADPRG